MNVIIVCEESQATCIEFRKRGHNAFSCDLQTSSGGHPEWHFNLDCFEVLKCGLLTLENEEKIFIDKWDLLIGHPPCTFLSNVGNTWFNIDKYFFEAAIRWENRFEAVIFFFKMMEFGKKIGKYCLENPVGYINGILKPSQTVNPYYFGDPFSKKTCYWIGGLPLLHHSKNDDMFFKKTHNDDHGEFITFKSGKRLSKFMNDALHLPKDERSKARSKSFPSIAKAMAEQWG